MVRDVRGRSTGISCVWDGMAYVAPCEPLSEVPEPPPLLLSTTEPLPVAAVTAPPPIPAPVAGLLQLARRPSPSPPLALLPPPPALVQQLNLRLSEGNSFFGQSQSHPKEEQFKRVEDALEEMGISALLRPDESPDWSSAPDAFEAELEQALRRRTRERVLRSTEPESVLTALGWFKIFRAAFPNYIPFRLLTGGMGDVAASAYNERTITRLGELMRLYGSRRPGARGKTLTAGSIYGVLSTFRALCTREAGYELELRSGRPGVKRMLKDMRREDGPRAVRKKREGFKAQHFEQAARAGLDRTSRAGRLRWAVMHFCHNAVARGSSAGVPKVSAPFDPPRGLTCCDVQLDLEKVGLPGLTVDVFPGKDCERRHVKRPIPISARPGDSWDGEGADPRDAYAAIRAEYDLMLIEVPLHLRACTPFFRRLGTLDPICTGDVAGFVADARQACGFQRDDHELAHELRIGGATDIRDYFGSEAGKQLLIDRGRWLGGKDIAFLYARTSVESQYEASICMGNANSRALEVVRPAWTQPGR